MKQAKQQCKDGSKDESSRKQQHPCAQPLDDQVAAARENAAAACRMWKGQGGAPCASWQLAS